MSLASRQSFPRRVRGRLLDKSRELLSLGVFRAAMTLGEKMTLTSKPAIIFAPHQDDETFGCGGLIALKVAQRVPVKVVFLTDGGFEGDADAERRRQVVDGRRREAVAATMALGLTEDDLVFLPFADGSLEHLSPMEQDEAIDQVVLLLNDFRPEEAFVTHRNDGHGDHVAAFRLVAEAIKRSGLKVDLYEYAIWLVWWSGFGRRLRWHDLTRARVLSIGGVAGSKAKAMAAFRSQAALLPRGFLKRFSWQDELFFATRTSAT